MATKGSGRNRKTAVAARHRRKKPNEFQAFSLNLGESTKPFTYEPDPQKFNFSWTAANSSLGNDPSNDKITDHAPKSVSVTQLAENLKATNIKDNKVEDEDELKQKYKSMRCVSVVSAVMQKNAGLVQYVLQEMKTSGSAVGRNVSAELTMALGQAVAMRDLPIIKLLLDHGAPIDGQSTTPNAYPVLITVVDRGHDDVLDLFLQYKANVHVICSHGNALHAAAKAGNPRMLQKLLELGVDVKAKSKTLNQTPLHVALINNHGQCVDILLQAEPDVCTADSTGMTVLHCAAFTGNAQACEALLAAGAHPMVVDVHWYTAWMYSVRYHQANAEKALRKHTQAAINDVSKEGRTCLHYCAIAGANNCVETLLEMGADVFAQDTAGNTPLMEAVSRGNVTVVKAITDARKGKCGVNMSNKKGETALSLALGKEMTYDSSWWLLEHLLDAGGAVEVLHSHPQAWSWVLQAANDSQRLDLCLGTGINTALLDSKGQSLLHQATTLAQFDILEILLHRNINLKVSSVQYDGFTPMTRALFCNNLKIVELLYLSGCSLVGVSRFFEVGLGDDVGKTGKASWTKMLSDIRSEANDIPRLSNLARTEILSMLGACGDYQEKIASLGIPTRLQDFLCIEKYIISQKLLMADLKE